MRPAAPSHPLLVGLSSTDQRLFWEYGIGITAQPAFHYVHQAFESHARDHPNIVAVEDFKQKITYGELDRRANCFAGRLRSLGVGPGSRVCLLVERSISMVVGIFAILKAGAAYVPLDGNLVADSILKHALKDSEARVVMIQCPLVE